MHFKHQEDLVSKVQTSKVSRENEAVCEVHKIPSPPDRAEQTVSTVPESSIREGSTLGERKAMKRLRW